MSKSTRRSFFKGAAASIAAVLIGRKETEKLPEPKIITFDRSVPITTATTVSFVSYDDDPIPLFIGDHDR